MSCNDNVCGTGGWTGPKPGDPDNNAVLSATPAYGGVDVRWTMPTTNAFAVSQVYVYRSGEGNFATATRIAVVAGDFYYDRIPAAEIHLYYYWIQFVSINGTVGAAIGPASATPMPLIAEIIRDLSGEIDAGLLATDLRTKIDRITGLDTTVSQEILNALARNEVLTAALDAVHSATGQALTFIQDEITHRETADSAIVRSVEAIAAGLGEAAAAMTEEKIVRASKDDAQAEYTRTQIAKFGTDTVSAFYETKLNVASKDKALADRIDAMVVRQGQSEGAIREIDTLTATSDSANARRVFDLTGKVDTAEGAIRDIQNVSVSSGSVLVQKLTTAEATLYGNVAQGQIGLKTWATGTDGKLIDIGGMYTVKLSANGVIGGFGVYNDSKSVEAGFAVDKFWIGSSSTSPYATPGKVYPFILKDSVVYINKACINELIFANIRNESGSIIGTPDGKLKAEFIETSNLLIKDPVTGAIKFGSGALLGWDAVNGKPTFGTLASQNNVNWISQVIGKESLELDLKNAKDTANQAKLDAKTANDDLAGISSDNFLTPNERPGVIREYNAILAEQSGLVVAAGKVDRLGQSDVRISTYNSAITALTTYLNGLKEPATPYLLWTAASKPIPIDPNTFNTKFSNVYTAKQALLDAFVEKAATTATWSGIPSGGGKPEDNATKGAVVGTSGSNLYVTMPNGAKLLASKLVTDLSKISPGTISDYMEGAAITSAYIGNAAVGTLKIGENAVTVPAAQTFYGTTEGNGGTSTVATLSITLDTPGVVFASSTGYISYGTGWRNAFTALWINGVQVSGGGGAEAWVNAAHSGGLYCSAGTVTVQLQFTGQSGCRIVNPTLFVIGAKR